MQKKYEILAKVGEGAYGIVYKCRNKEKNKIVAVKKFKETNDAIVQKTMKRELYMLQLLKNENIVDFQEAFTYRGNLYLVFEFVEKNLLEVLQESPQGLNPKLIRSFVYQMCKAVSYLHKNNMIHRDVKPENLLIDSNMKLKLCDFGFARKIALDNNNNNEEQMTDYVATRWYRAPELLLSQGIYGPAVDYWAIGCIMGELVDGEPMFPGEDEVDQLNCIIKIMGNLPEDQVKMYKKNSIYNRNPILSVSRPETLEKRYLGKLGPTAIDFLKGLLQLDPNKRLNGDTVFKHKYLQCFVEKDNKVNNTQSINNINIVNANSRKNEKLLIDASPSETGRTKKKSVDLKEIAKNKNNINNENKELKESNSKKEIYKSVDKFNDMSFTKKIINNTININIITYNATQDEKNKNKNNKNESISNSNKSLNPLCKTNTKFIGFNNINKSNNSKSQFENSLNHNENINKNNTAVEFNDIKTSNKTYKSLECTGDTKKSSSSLSKIQNIGEHKFENSTLSNNIPKLDKFSICSIGKNSVPKNGYKNMFNLSNKNSTMLNFNKKKMNLYNNNNINNLNNLYTSKYDHGNAIFNNNDNSINFNNKFNAYKTFFNKDKNTYNYKINTIFKGENNNNKYNNVNNNSIIDEYDEIMEINKKKGSVPKDKHKNKLLVYYPENIKYGSNNSNNIVNIDKKKIAGYGTFYNNNKDNYNFGTFSKKKNPYLQLPKLFKPHEYNFDSKQTFYNYGFKNKF